MVGNRLTSLTLVSFFVACSGTSEEGPLESGGDKSALSSVPDRSATPSTPCAIGGLANTGADAAAALAACVAATPPNGVLALPPGVYSMGTRLELNKPITITTEGRVKTAACGREVAHGCAELRALPSLLSPYGLLIAQGGGVVVDHIVLDGARPERAAALAECHSGVPARMASGFNARMINCANCGFLGSTSKRSVCGSALEVAGPANTGANVIDSDFAFNGMHDDESGWSDGLTVHDGAGIAITNNRFHDNTDVDLILGGCQNCTVDGNAVTHDGSYATASFTAIMIQAFALSTSGRYDGSVITRNTVDCTDKPGCGIGLYVGSRAWYEANRVVNGTIVGNDVRNAQFGIIIGRDVTGTNIGDNDAGPSNGNAQCNTKQQGLRDVFALAVEPGSEAVFSGGRVPRRLYVESLLRVGTVPNSAPGCVARPGPANPPPAPTPAVSCPWPNYALVPNRHFGGAVQCVPSCGHAGVDAARGGAHLAEPNRADPRVAAEVGAMCSLNGLAYLFSYEEAMRGQVCCASL